MPPRAGPSTFPNRLLVVDDDAAILRLLADLVGAQGVEVQTAESAAEAFALCTERNFGAALIDKNMPDIDGLETMRELRKLQPHCACIMMTAFTSADSAIEALRLGAVDYLEKPFKSIQLVAEKVVQTLRQQRAVFERETLLRTMDQFKAELENQNEELDRQRDELETFNALLESRVKTATEDLSERCRILAMQLATAMSGEDTIRASATQILAIARSIRLREGEPASAVRGELERVIRQLEEHLGLIETVMKS